MIMIDKQQDSKRIIVSERFRTPLALERGLGLWLDRIGAGVNERDKGGLAPLRKLGLFAVVCVTNGSGAFHSEPSGVIKVEEGDVMMLFPDIPSIYRPDKKWETEWIVWGGREGEAIASIGLFDAFSPVFRGKSQVVSDARAKLLALIGSESPSSVLKRKVVILEMLLELTRRSGGFAGDSGSRMEKAVAHIDRNLNDDISIGDVATYCGYSETHFRRLFNQVMGMSPKQFIISRKISRAKEYLSSGRTVKETAEAAGFKNDSYFRSAFKKFTGFSPGEFTRSLMGKR